MPGTGRVIHIEVEANGGQYNATIKGITDSTRQLGQAAADAGAQSTQAFTRMQANIIALNQAFDLAMRGVNLLQRGLQSLIGAAAESETVTNDLAAALQITGRNIPVERFQEYASALEAMTTQDDEAILRSATLLTQLTNLDEKGIQRAVKGAVGLATVMGKDLQGATLAVARALTGNAQGLQRVGISIDETLPLQKQQQQIMEKLAPLYARAEAETRTYDGSTKQLKNSIGNLLEDLGKPLIGALAGVQREISPLVKWVQEWAGRNQELVNGIVILIGIIVGAGGLTVAFGLLGVAITTFITSPTGWIVFLSLIGAAGVTFLVFKNRINEFIETMSKAGAQSGLKKMTDELNALENAQRNFQESARPLPSENVLATQRAGRIAELKKSIEEREKLIAQFEAAEFKGGTLPKIEDKSGETAAKKAADLEEKKRSALAASQKAVAALNLTMLEARKANGEYDVDLQGAIKTQIRAEQSAALLAAEHDKVLTPALRNSINELAKLKLAQVDDKAADERRKARIEEFKRDDAERERQAQEAADLIAAAARDKEFIIQQVSEEIRIKEQLLALDVDLLRIQGHKSEADQKEIQNTIELINQRRSLLAQRGIEESDTEAAERVARVRNAQAQLQQLGEVTINVGQTIANSVGDAFEGVILGTRKLSEVGKGLMAALTRDIAKFFTEALVKKLGFEKLIFSNLRGFVPQANQALMQGASAVPGAGGAGGGGGIFDFLGNIFGGGGSSGGGGGGGGIFDFLGNIFGGGSSSGGGGGGGGFFSSIAGLFGGSSGGGGGGFFSNILGGISNLVGNFSGGGGGGILGMFQNILGGFSDFVSGVWGAGASGGIAGLQNFFSGSVGAGASGFTSAWAAAANEGVGTGAGAFGGALNGIGGAFTSGLLPLITAAFTDGFSKQKLGTTLGTSIGAAIGTYIFPGIGTVIGAVVGSLIGSLFNQKPNPTAVLKAKFSGVFYDALEGVFKPGDITTNVTRKGDMKGSAAHGIAAMVQEALTAQADIWTGLLNMFPRSAREAIVPGLGEANDNLNNAFGRLKFTEGGRRSIEQELRDLSGWEGGRGFFHAMRASIGTGFETVLREAGLDNVAEAARDQFQRGVLLRGGRAEGNVMQFPEDDENAQKFIQAIANMIGLTSQLGNLSPRGIQPFITEADRAFLERGFGSVFNQNSDPLAFIKNAEALQEKIAPVMDFLKQAISESTSLLGNGIIAALEASSNSTALREFHRILGEGTRDLVFKGITEAALASAQFNDLLAPIQQVIRDTTQNAIASGNRPDLSNFLDAVRPLLGDLDARAELLRPFIEALSELGRQFGIEFERFTGSGGGGVRVEINIENWQSSTDPSAFARFLENELNGLH